MSSSFHVLTICTGNICRSPLAEHLLASHLSDIPEITVASAGTEALVGEPMFDVTCQIAESFGLPDTKTHRSRQVDEQILTDADLILTMSRSHRRSVVKLSPRVTRRVFTIREFGRLAAATTDETLAEEMDLVDADDVSARLSAAVRAVSASRGLPGTQARPEDDDVVDPYQRDTKTHQESAAQLEIAVEPAVELLRRAAGRSA